MKSTRRTIVFSGMSAAAAACLRYPANAAEFTYKFGMPSATTHPTAIRAAEACKRIQAESNGRLEVQLFPRSMLGDNTSMLSQVRTGAIQIYGGIGFDLASVVPLCAL